MRLLVVSNRAPVTVTVKDGETRISGSPGGLATGVASFLERRRAQGPAEDLWIGWPGIASEEWIAKELETLLLSDYGIYPVALSEESISLYYDGLCNGTIWPLFHYFPSLVTYSEENWQEYERVNRLFCDAVVECASEDDWIWVHDYHLMLLPALLRERLPGATIGFFLHIPFPSFEIFRLLPRQWGSEILAGLLASDLIGFHTQEYTQNFLRCALKIMGYEHNLGDIAIEDEGRMSRADTFPMGIDFMKYSSANDRPGVQKCLENIRRSVDGVKVVLSIDRLDYTKGIANRLRGFRAFLEENPGYHEKVVLALVVVPSRTSVGDYRRMKREIDIMVGEINGGFGNLGWTPILYQYRSLPLDELLAYYLLSDVAMLTPKRDGMNLIAKEYLAARNDGTGVLVLSEMAGAARELGEAILVNPNHVKEISTALAEALEMPVDEQLRRTGAMRRRLQRYDVVRWAEEFLESMQKVREMQAALLEKLIDPSTMKELLDDFAKTGQKLLALDYDGTLVPINLTPDLASPSGETRDLLRKLSRLPDTSVAVVSGRDRDTLQRWFGELDISLVAEHGAWIRQAGGGWKPLAFASKDWKESVIQLFDKYVDRLPGSFVEEKEYSVAWHYRLSELESGNLRAMELTSDLIDYTANMNLQVLQGSKVIEVRHTGIDKGNAVLELIGDNQFDFILAIGDDWTDEDIFGALPETSYTFRVGTCSSKARFHLERQPDVVVMLERLAGRLMKSPPPDTFPVTGPE